MAKQARLLIIDDEKNQREGLRKLLGSSFDTAATDSAARGLDLIYESHFDLVITDLRMPGIDGVELVKRVQTMDSPPAVIVITAYPDVNTAVDAIKMGAYDYLQKPVDPDKLEITVRRCLEARGLSQENQELKRQLASRYAFENLVGSSQLIQEIQETIAQIAPARSTVLLTGESGTGKELAARALHQLSPRASRAFVAVHCAALSANLLESELFGHEKGAFTGASERRVGRFEAADGGTLFLDEIGEIEPSVQVTLLRILESRSFERVGGTEPITVDVRLVAATNRDLMAEVRAGRFREDLYYRLDVLRLHMPALRDRREDIPLLLKYFLDFYTKENDRQLEGFTPEAVRALSAYDWPGNVRELRNAVERMVVLARGDSITMKDVPDLVRHAAADARVTPESALDMEANEKRLIVKALDECDGNRTAAARKLGISRRTLHRKLHQFGLMDS